MIISIENMQDHEGRDLPDMCLELDMKSIHKRGNLAFVFYKTLCRLILPETKRQNTRTIAELLIASDKIDARLVNPVMKAKAEMRICAKSMTVSDKEGDNTVCITDYINKNLTARIAIKLGLSYQPVFLFEVDGTQYVTCTKTLVFSFFQQSERYIKSKKYDPQLHDKIVWLGNAARNQVLERELRDITNIVADLQMLEEMKLSISEEA